MVTKENDKMPSMELKQPDTVNLFTVPNLDTRCVPGSIYEWGWFR